jgi:hypothetical protein
MTAFENQRRLKNTFGSLGQQEDVPKVDKHQIVKNADKEARINIFNCREDTHEGQGSSMLLNYEFSTP